MNYTSLDTMKPKKKKKPGVEEKAYNIKVDNFKKDNVYFSDIYMSGLRTEQKHVEKSKDINESNMSIVLESLNNHKSTKNKSNKNLAKKHKTNFGSELNSEVKGIHKTRKKRKKESVASIEISKEFFSCLLETLFHSDLNLAQSLYRKLLHHFFEYMILIEEKTKNLFANRSLVVNYLELLFKLLIRKNVKIEEYPMEELLGRPKIFPLKLKMHRMTNKKNVLTKFDRKFNIQSDNALFNNKKHSNQILLIFRRIAQKAQGILGFDIEDTIQKMTVEKQYQSQQRKSKHIISYSTFYSNFRVEANQFNSHFSSLIKSK